MDVNFWGMVYLSHNLLPAMEEAESAWIVNVSSVYGLFAMESQTAYCSSKFAVRGFTEALKMELLSTGSSVAVTAVYPARIRTDIVKNSVVNRPSTELSKDEIARDFTHLAKITDEDAAEVIIKGIIKQKLRILIDKQAIQADSLVRLIPGSYYRPILKSAHQVKKSMDRLFNRQTETHTFSKKLGRFVAASQAETQPIQK